MEIYCNQIGMVIDFSYCVSSNEGLPCRNVVDCFQGRIDILAVLKKRFTAEELEKAFKGLPKSRLERILESIQANS
jgi:hypothetical protein